MTGVPAGCALPQPLDAEGLFRLLPLSSPVILLLDYDGTLVPFAPLPDQASPDPDLLGLLVGLGARPDRQVSIVSGRTRVQIDRWFGAMPMGLYAEHGVWCRPSKHEAWRRLEQPVDAWPPDIVEALEKAGAMLPGSLLEVKSASLTFHFRAAARKWVDRTIPWLRGRLASLAAENSYRFVEGAELLELRTPGVSKATAATMILQQSPPGATVVALGDDTTDEDMFRALPGSAMTVHVGSGPTAARYAMEGPTQVRSFLSRLL